MVKNRLFTLGCSYTGYFWPSWADLIGTQYNQVYNYGKAGCGNYFILSQLNEINEIYKLTKDDTVLVMISSDNRADFIQWMGTWTATGGIYADGNLNYFGETFPKNIWSPLHGLHNTWISLKSIKLLLDSIGCNFRLYTAFPQDSDGKDFWNEMLSDIDENSNVDYNSVTLLNDRISNLLSSTISLESFINEDTPRYEFYDKITGSYKDYHPTVKEHLNWVKSVASEFYDEKMESIASEWNNIVINDSQQEIKSLCGLSDHNELISGKELK